MCSWCTTSAATRSPPAVARHVAGRGGRIILITDRWLSPVAPHAESVLVARTESVSPFDSLTAATALTEALGRRGERAARDRGAGAGGGDREAGRRHRGGASRAVRSALIGGEGRSVTTERMHADRERRGGRRGGSRARPAAGCHGRWSGSSGSCCIDSGVDAPAGREEVAGLLGEWAAGDRLRASSWSRRGRQHGDGEAGRRRRSPGRAARPPRHGLPAGTAAQLGFAVRDGRAFGPGVADMKGGLLLGWRRWRRWPQASAASPPSTSSASPMRRRAERRARWVRPHPRRRRLPGARVRP